MKPVVRGFLALVAVLSFAAVARADDFPKHPITMIVPFAAETDAVKKRFAELSTVAPDVSEYTPELLQQFVTRDVEKYRKLLEEK